MAITWNLSLAIFQLLTDQALALTLPQMLYVERLALIQNCIREDMDSPCQIPGARRWGN
jgi:hypothetical protein